MNSSPKYPFKTGTQQYWDANFMIKRMTSWSFELVSAADKKRFETLSTKEFISDVIRHLRALSKVQNLDMWQSNVLNRLNSSVPP